MHTTKNLQLTSLLLIFATKINDKSINIKPNTILSKYMIDKSEKLNRSEILYLFNGVVLGRTR